MASSSSSTMMVAVVALIALSIPLATCHLPPEQTTPPQPITTTPPQPTTTPTPPQPTTPPPPTDSSPKTPTEPSLKPPTEPSLKPPTEPSLKPPTEPSLKPPTLPSIPIVPPKGASIVEPPCCADEAIKSVPGCKQQIKTTYTVITEGTVKMGHASVMVGGKYIKIGSACCEVVNSISDICWKLMYPRCPIAVFFRGVCSIFGKASGPPTLNKSSMCMGALRKVPGCLKQINETVSIATVAMIRGFKSHHEMHENVEEMGSSCCKVIDGISDPCWQEMYPAHPQFSQVVKGVCSVVGRSVGRGGKLFKGGNRKFGDGDKEAEVKQPSA